ncbi:MAG: aldo/keto reductase [Gemmatimonadetes bacterium]|nr:aldo/keto reductase [Gemmatimonadota bacterium]
MAQRAGVGSQNADHPTASAGDEHARDGVSTSRRRWLRTVGGAAAALAIRPELLSARDRPQDQALIQRPIPGTDERLPVVGLGGANTFAEVALEESRDEEYSRVRGVLQALVDGGGSVFDTAYGYGASEQVAGQVAQELGVANRIWWATKVNAARVSGGVSEPADPDAVRYQVSRSFQRLRLRQVDLFQVHNMGDPPTQLRLLRELKDAGYVRYVGITTTFEPQYDALVDVMRTEPLDFIGIDYAVDNRSAEDVILPLAQDRGIGVMVYQPFGRTRMWARIGDRALPDWATDFDARSWAQFMLKFVIAHPAVTVVCPGTSDPVHVVDNLGAGRGRLPDAGELDEIVRLVDGLPGA